MQNEADLEDDGIVPEVVKPTVTTSKDLMLFMEESELEPVKQQFLIEKYAEHFEMAALWAKKATKIIVTNEKQLDLMEEAKVARLFLRKKRLEIENSRKMLKAGALKECQVIDRVASFLKDVIIPSEEHLERQEKFIEFRQKAEDERLLAEVKKREEERLAEEAKKQTEEHERLRIENEKLRKEQAERDKVEAEKKRIAQEAYNKEMEKIRKENEAKLAKERLEAEKLRKEQEAKLAKERIEREKVEQELREKKQAELKAEADKARAEEALLKAGDTDKLIAFKKAVESIKIPEVKSAINKRIIEDAKSHLFLAVSKINIIQEEE